MIEKTNKRHRTMNKSRLRWFKYLYSLKKNWFIIIFMINWLGGWVMGNHLQLVQFSTLSLPYFCQCLSAILVNWLDSRWTFSFYIQPLDTLVGREIINVDKRIIRISKIQRDWKESLFMISSQSKILFLLSTRI